MDNPFVRTLGWISIAFSLLGLAFIIAASTGSSRPALYRLPGILNAVGMLLLVSSLLLRAQRPRLATFLLATSLLFAIPAFMLIFVGMD